MERFRYCVPTPLYFGDHCVEQYSHEFCRAGKRAFIITTHFPEGIRHYALEDVESVLGKLHIPYVINYDVRENPPVESVEVITREARAFGADFLIGIGGGSAIDTAKAVSVLYDRMGEDPYRVFYLDDQPFGSTTWNEGTLPVIAIPTTAGTGSEVTGGSVLTRVDTDTKLSISQQVYPLASFCDARYIQESPYFLLDTGAMDALAHGVESFVAVTSNPIQRHMAGYGFQLFRKFKDALLNKTMKDQDFSHMMLASTVQGMSFMQVGTTLPHGMSYPLSHFKGVNHGLGCAVFLGEYLRCFQDQSLVQPILTQCGFGDTISFANYIRTVTHRNISIQVTEEELQQWTDTFMTLDFRIALHPEPVTRNDVYRIYHDSLIDYLV